MAVSVIEDLQHSPVATKAAELNVADDGKDSNDCKHFTIRGYVSEVRKRDANISWPFQHYNCSSLECAKMLPPLHVAQFRWWDCQNCVHGIMGNAAEMATEGAVCLEAVKDDKKELQDSISRASHLVTMKVLSKLPQISKGNCIEERFLMDDFPVANISLDGNTESKYVLRNLMHEGSKIFKGDHDRTNEKKIPLGEANYVPATCEAPKLREKGIFENSSNGKGLWFVPSRNSLNSVLLQHDETRLHQLGHSKMLDGPKSFQTNIAVYSTKEDEGLLKMKTNGNEIQKKLTKKVRVDLVNQKDVLYANLGRRIGHDGPCQDEKGCCGALEDYSDNIVLTDEDPEILSHIVERLNVKKVKKVRLLADIIQSGEQNMPRYGLTPSRNPKTINGDLRRHAIVRKKVLLLNHNSDSSTPNLKSAMQTYRSQRGIDDDEDMEGTPNFGQRCHLFARRNFIKPLESGKGDEVLPDKGEVPSLMHRLKANARKGRSNANSINCPINISGISADMTVGKNHDENITVNCRRMYEQKTPVDHKQTLITKDGHVTSTIRTSNIRIHRSARSKQFSSKNISIKDSHTIGKTQLCGLETKDNTSREEFLLKMRNKRTIIDRGKPSQAKDTFAAQQQAASKGREEATKMQRNEATAMEALDDIPMDIVELLARNQHERHHLIAEADNRSNPKMSEAYDSTETINGLDAIQTNSSIVSDAERRNLSHQKFQVSDKGFGVKTIFHRDADFNHGLKIHNLPINGKKNLHMDLNRHYCEPVICKAASCNLGSNRDCGELNFSCCGANIKASQHWLRDPITECQHLCRNNNDGERLHINSHSFGVKAPLYRKSTPSILDSNMQLFAHLDDGQNLRNLIGKDQQIFPNNETTSVLTSTKLVNRHQSKVDPVNVYSNETISALNLLRLMDWAAWSGESQHCLKSYARFTNKTGINANDQYNEPLGSEYGGTRKEPCICPREIVNPLTSPKPRNSCMPYRPLPRVGVLGPALQKEIWNSSSLSGLPVRNSAELFLQDDEKEKTGTSHLWQSETGSRCNNSLARVGPNRGPGTFLIPNTVACSACNCTTQIGVSNKVDTVLPHLGFCKVENCGVNRNPADFAMLDENNEYMIEMKVEKHECLPRSERYRGSSHVQKKQRVMKLTDLKGFAVG
ncbi:Protein embryonic flower 1 [Apostasia shenzhenica]|uniref:Protein embryonic flower 1 n=1 Tax=Apostasia shenzhenica TaxID=1088818 RepID=A0A2I0AIF3_9ASPA|nr:Protein embryonic flower 1 [Apostasia shenzhenica]